MDLKILQNILNDLVKLRNDILDYEIDEDLGQNESLHNLKAYLNLRSKNIVDLQNRLASIGLSSLGRAQSCIVSSINQDIEMLLKILNKEESMPIDHSLSCDAAKDIMLKNAEIFGIYDKEFETKVMVTLPSEAADSPELISNLILGGTSVLRINTAHDDPLAWQRMAAHIKNENEIHKADTKIYVDLAGPKNRTGQIIKVFLPFTIGSKREPKRVKLLPKSLEGFKTQKASKGKDAIQQNASLVIDDSLYELCFNSKEIFVDDIGRRKKHVCELRHENGAIYLLADKKITIFEETKLWIDQLISNLHNFELEPQEIRLFQEDKFILSKINIQGNANFKYNNKVFAGIIECSNKEIFPYVKIGDPIYIDDGKIGCLVEEINEIGLICNVFLAKKKGTVLKEAKGVNFPNTDLAISAITASDEENLKIIMEFADIIGLSFAQSKNDIQKIQALLFDNNKKHIAIAPKIETKTALRNLPEILEQLIRWDRFALMIARGDLAIEVGFDNLPYIQEEIFGICEAAHVPVIYATQILEGQMKNNLPSRSEVTDAALAQRADCVMLNKGPYVLDALTTIQHILQLAHTLYQKNRQLLGICAAWKVETKGNK